VILGAFERRVARCFAGGMFLPSASPPLPGGGDVALDDFLEQLLDRAPARMRIGTRLALWAFALAPLFIVGRFRLATGLAPDDLERYTGAWLTHRVYFIRSIGFFLKAFAAMAYFRDRRVQAALGLPGA